MNKKFYVYLTTNLINNKQYIGYHYGNEQDSYLGSGVKLLEDIKQYGKENFKKEILEYCSTSEECFEKEKYWIKFYNAVNNENFYNIDQGGTGGWIGAHEYWKNHKEEQNEILKKARAIHSSKGFTEKQRQACKENIKKANAFWKEHRDEHLELLKTTQPKAVEARKKKVKCITTGEIFDSVHAAEVKYNIYKGGVSRCALGKSKKNWIGKHPITGEKLQWEYI